MGNIGIAAAEREAADDRHAAGPEQSGLREARSLTIAIEKTSDAHAFGMIATETGVDSKDLFKTVDEADRCQFMRIEPASQIEKPTDDQYDHSAHPRQSRQRP